MPVRRPVTSNDRSATTGCSETFGHSAAFSYSQAYATIIASVTWPTTSAPRRAHTAAARTAASHINVMCRQCRRAARLTPVWLSWKFCEPSGQTEVLASAAFDQRHYHLARHDLGKA